jgi:hypothetical protein
MARETSESSFDELARGLASGNLSRGKALRLAGGALLGVALASLPGTALAHDDDCRSFGRRCRRDSQCCSKNCVRRGDDKVCGCPEGQRRCNDRCVNLKRNENHCGSCSNRCAEGEQCVEGMCAPACVSNGVSCTADTDCCSGLLCDNGQCATCRSTGGSCTTNGECCSGNCSGGTCRPTGTGPNLVTCGCPDGTSVDACDSFDCSSPQPFFALCSSLCASHGGLPVSFLGCGASAVCQPPV